MTVAGRRLRPELSGDSSPWRPRPRGATGLPATPESRSSDTLYGPVIVLPLFAAAVAGITLLPWLIQLSPPQAALCFLQASITAAGIARAAYPVLRPVALVTFVFTFSWLAVAPVYQLSHGLAAWGDNAVLASPHTTPALLLLVLATAVMYVGFFNPLSATRTRTSINGAPIAPPRYLCGAYLLIALALTPRAVSASGGMAAMFSSREARGATLAAQGLTLEAVGGVQLALVAILPGAMATAATYLVLIRVINQFGRARWAGVSAADAAMLLVGFGLVVLLVNPFVNTRAFSAAAIGSLFLLVLRPRSRRAGAWMAVVLIFGTLVAYPAANEFRGTANQYASGFEALSSADFDGFQQTINTMDFVEDLGHSWGSYTLSGSLYFIPRSLWTDKEIPASLDVAAHRGYEFTNLSLPFHAEMYIDFGVVGMCLVLFLLSTAGRRCDMAWMSGAPSRLAMLTPYACLACLSIIRGPIGANGPGYLTTLGLIGAGLLVAQVPVAAKASVEARDPTRPQPLTTAGRCQTLQDGGASTTRGGDVMAPLD